MGGEGQSAQALLEFSLHTEVGMGASHICLPLPPDPTGALGQCLVRGTGGRTLQIPAAKGFLGRVWGIERGQAQVLTLVSGTVGEERESCVGACVS